MMSTVLTVCQQPVSVCVMCVMMMLMTCESTPQSSSSPAQSKSKDASQPIICCLQYLARVDSGRLVAYDGLFNGCPFNLYTDVDKLDRLRRQIQILRLDVSMIAQSCPFERKMAQLHHEHQQQVQRLRSEQQPAIQNVQRSSSIPIQEYYSTQRNTAAYKYNQQRRLINLWQ